MVPRLAALERAAGGWGLAVPFLLVPWIPDGPWYLTWLTSCVLLVLFFRYGRWYGLVYRSPPCAGSRSDGSPGFPAQALALPRGWRLRVPPAGRLRPPPSAAAA